MCSFVQEDNEETPPKYEPNKEQGKHEYCNWIKNSHQYTHEYVYHHNVTKDVAENVNKMALYSFHHEKER